jgi:hypothetical protein
MLMMRLGMAESRGVSLSRRLLAKLMILEYLKPELFRQLGDMQAEGHGRPEPLLTMQNEGMGPAGSTGVVDDSKGAGAGKADARLEVWLKDPIAVEWLKLEPALDDTDLGPYFYFSRDVLTDHGQQAQRMGPAAREVYRKLLSHSGAVRKSGLAGLSGLSPAEASSVLAEICERSRSEEDTGAEGSALSLLFEICQARQDVASDVITFIGTRPHDQLPLWAPPRLHEAVRGTGFLAAARSVIEQWAGGANKRLATTASKELRRMDGDSK